MRNTKTEIITRMLLTGLKMILKSFTPMPILGLMLVYFKATGVVHLEWYQVLIPFYIFPAIFVSFFVLLGAVVLCVIVVMFAVALIIDTLASIKRKVRRWKYNRSLKKLS